MSSRQPWFRWSPKDPTWQRVVVVGVGMAILFTAGGLLFTRSVTFALVFGPLMGIFLALPGVVAALRTRGGDVQSSGEGPRGQGGPEPNPAATHSRTDPGTREQTPREDPEPVTLRQSWTVAVVSGLVFGAIRFFGEIRRGTGMSDSLLTALAIAAMFTVLIGVMLYARGRAMAARQKNRG